MTDASRRRTCILILRGYQTGKPGSDNIKIRLKNDQTGMRCVEEKEVISIQEYFRVSGEWE